MRPGMQNLSSPSASSRPEASPHGWLITHRLLWQASGAGFRAGFFFGWASRRFLKMAALVTGGLLAGIAVLEETGWIDLDWTSVETQISQAVTATHQGAQGLKHLLSGYLPSTGAAAVGMFFGFLKK